MEVVMNSSLSAAGFGHWYDNTPMADGGRVDLVYGHGFFFLCWESERGWTMIHPWRRKLLLDTRKYAALVIPVRR